ncbi:hypothetical protein PR202_gb29196 [Eleusine coracana subsp. coracana]|uniref:Uncharacterized protein n=1 Tax=Eleusine coracana subsp. coracana TaxID=191504 RepID=A0AAV5FWG9_ELECO|nr:hypothetical protein PR202_gb29196 [Eleusine coracana subsp. coracana]
MEAPAHSPAVGSSSTRSTHPPWEQKQGMPAAGPTGEAAAAEPTPARRGHGAAKLAATCVALPLLAAGPVAALLVGQGDCRRSWWPSVAPGTAPTARRCRSCPPPPSNSPQQQGNSQTKSIKILSFEPARRNQIAQLPRTKNHRSLGFQELGAASCPPWGIQDPGFSAYQEPAHAEEEEAEDRREVRSDWTASCQVGD